MENFEFKNSSNIKSASYDTDTKDMTIIFKGDSKYVYRDIPVDVYKKFTEAESAGKFFYSNIRNHYKYNKM